MILKEKDKDYWSFVMLTNKSGKMVFEISVEHHNTMLECHSHIAIVKASLEKEKALGTDAIKQLYKRRFIKGTCVKGEHIK